MVARSRLRGVLILGGGTLLAAVFGLLFQSLLSYHFGAGAETDAWFMSLSIYGFLGKFLMLTNLKAIALPLYRRLRDREEAAAARFERRLLLWVAGIAAVLSGVLVLASPLLVKALAPGYEGAVESLTVSLVRIRLPALGFLAVGTCGLVALEAAGRFEITVLSQKILPAALTLALFALLADGLGMVGLGWIGLAGGVAGGLVALWAMAPLLSPGSPGTLETPEGRGGADDALKDVGRQWISFSSSNGASLLAEWVFRVAASLLPVGLFSAVLYGRMVQDLLHGAVNDSAQAVSLPRFAAAASSAAPGSGDLSRRVGVEVRESMSTLAAVTLPLATFVALAAPWAVAVLFGRGRFIEDGVLGAASLSLQIFSVGFFVQGLNQLLFAGAFASGHSGAVNRVQVVGHLTRAAMLVPAVMALSFAGLALAQVLMNVIVFVVFLRAAPTEWGMGLTGVARRTHRGSLAGVVLATALVLGAWVPVLRALGDPLAWATPARIGILCGLAMGWGLTYFALAWLFRVDMARRAWSRLRSLTVVAVVALLAATGSASAQSAAGTLLPARHWSVNSLALLEAQGLVPVGASSAGPLSGARVDALLAGAGSRGEVALAWLRWERGGPVAARVGGGWQRSRGPGGGRGHARWVGDVSLGTAKGRFFGGASMTGEGWSPSVEVSTAEVGARLGPLALRAGRFVPQLGGGAGGATVLSAAVPLDGALLTTERLVDLPLLGPTALTAGVFPLGNRYGAVTDPWFAAFRMASHPAPWLEVGLSRGALLGGRFPGGGVPWDGKVYEADQGSMSAGDVVDVFLWRSTLYDDQIASLDVRASLAGLGVPLLAYAEAGLEDGDRSWGDPAVLAGFLVAPKSEGVGIRYEYAAFGASARLCAWCDTLPAFWYQHVRFQDGWAVAGEPLGHPLGGYGTQHFLGVSVTRPNRRLSLEVTGGRLRRDAWNLLEATRPGAAWWWGLGFQTGWRRDLEVRGSVRGEKGDSGWSRGTAEMILAVLLGG